MIWLRWSKSSDGWYAFYKGRKIKLDAQDRFFTVGSLAFKSYRLKDCINAINEYSRGEE